MKKYKVVYIDEGWEEGAAVAEEKMNEMAKEGWEVVNVCGDSDSLYITFSREIPLQKQGE